MRRRDALLAGIAVIGLMGLSAAPTSAAAGYGSPDNYLSVGQDPWGIASADVDADGDVDLFSSNFNDNLKGLSVYVNAGNGTFNPPTTYSTGNNPETLAVGRFDAGKDQDVAVGSNASASVLLGASGSLFGPTQNYGSWSPVQTRGTGTGDFNGDGKTDLVVDEDEQKLVFFRGKGDGTFAPQRKSKLGPGGAGEIATGKLNGDKRFDVVVAGDGKKGVLVRLGHSGKRGFGKARRYPAPPDAVDVALADMNGDADRDIVISGGREAKRGGGNRGVVYVLLGKGNGRFGAAKLTPLGNASVTGVAVGDLNGDGDVDAAVGKYDGKVLVLFGKGNGRFSSPQTLDTGLNGTTMLLAARLNPDKKPDLAVTNGTDNQITVFLHN